MTSVPLATAAMTAEDRPLSILHVTNGSDAGGLSRYIFDLSCAMHERGHKVAVAGQRGAWHWLFEKAPFPWIEIPAKGGPLSALKSAATLKRYLQDHPADILHTHYRRGTLIARRVQKQMQALRVEMPVLYTLHLSHIAIGWPQRVFSDFGDHTHVASEQARRWLVDDAHIDPSRITLIPHGIDPTHYALADDATRAAARQSLGLSADARVAAYVGRLDYPKNVDWILDLAEVSRQKLPDLKLLLVGEGPKEAELRHAVESRKLGDRVTFLGHRDPLSIYQAIDALLLPSLREGFSLVTAEAMSVGTTALRTRTSGTGELVIEDETGVSTPIDRDAFVKTAVDFLADRARLRRMGLAAAEHVRRSFTMEQQLARTEALYRQLARPTADASRARR